VANSTLATDNRYEVPPLDEGGENYLQWSNLMKLALELRDVWDMVDGSNRMPDVTTHPDEHAEWRRKDREARLQILCGLREGPRRHLPYAASASAKDFWDALASQYLGGGGRTAVPLMESLFMSHFSESEPLQQQIDKVVRTVRHLNCIGFPLSDKWLASILIMKLPESLLKMVLINIENAKLTASNGVITRILADEGHRIHASGGSATTYFAKAAKKAKHKNKQDEKKKKTCSHCNRKGHEKYECRKLKEEKEKVKGSKGSKESTPSPSAAPET
jgi:hypothetical protein